jgi:hypothetical protein
MQAAARPRLCGRTPDAYSAWSLLAAANCLVRMLVGSVRMCGMRMCGVGVC